MRTQREAGTDEERTGRESQKKESTCEGQQETERERESE